MKKLLCLVLCLLMMMSPAMADRMVRFGDLMEVVNCKEYITLRAEPSTKAEALDRIPLGAAVRTLGAYDDRFERVLYGGQAGYVLSEYLSGMQTASIAYAEVTVAEGSAEYSSVNRFLSNFTDRYFMNPCGYFDVDSAPDAELVQFAIAQVCFEHPDYMEWDEWGDDGNVRLSDEHIAPVCEKYFGRVPENYEPLYMNYSEGYYYWYDIGGRASGGFACMTDIERVGANEYRAYFDVYGQEFGWDEDVHSMGVHELLAAHPEYFSEYLPRGCAVFSVGVGDLSDPDGWVLKSFCMDWENFGGFDGE